ncbi:hypothetical protein HPB51_003452 [Rhipicephalus microplus]|uniref:Uncharacterized protein n=1 Tax=Rhipicephalus microplus TaxID=6941 RepID=A0A9J6EWF8_RHIMP|nr:hypothetical protein HPB51_003452 [Rhipicephalus microplus]
MAYINNWLEHAPQPEAGAYELRETPSYSQALRRDSSDATCRGGKEMIMNPAAPETVAARSPGQHTPSGPPSPSAQLPSRLPLLSSTPTTHTPETVTKGNPGQQQRPAVPKSTATRGQNKPPARKNQQPTSSTNKQQPPAANSRRLQASSSREAQRDGAPTQTRVYATLKPPRSNNHHHGSRNHNFIRSCNSEACFFNLRLRDYCRRSRKVFYVDHGFEWLPPFRVLAADGFHPSFEGVSSQFSILLQAHQNRILVMVRLHV